MIKSFIAALALTAVAITGIGSHAEAKTKTKAGTHLMLINPPKAAPYAQRHDNATCPNMPR
jgi:hypothetical protein